MFIGGRGETAGETGGGTPEALETRINGIMMASARPIASQTMRLRRL
jgi:hypothetical protein